MNEFTQVINQNPANTRTTQVIEGEWHLGQGDLQSCSHLEFDGGGKVLGTDSLTVMGDGATHPGPMHYWFYSMASSYTGVFASIAASLGVTLKSLNTRVEADMEFSESDGVINEPTVGGIRVILRIISGSTAEMINKVETLALGLCPVMGTIHHQIKLVPCC